MGASNRALSSSSLCPDLAAAAAGIVPALANLVHTATLEGRCCNKLQFADGKAETRRDKGFVQLDN